MPTCNKPGCECGGVELPRPTRPYTGLPSLHVLKATTWVCTCPGLRPRQRHGEPWLCVSTADLAVWRLRTNNFEVSDPVARMLAWLEREFTSPSTPNSSAANDVRR